MHQQYTLRREKTKKRAEVLNENNTRAKTTIRSIYVANQKRQFCCLLQFWRAENKKKSRKSHSHTLMPYSLVAVVCHWRCSGCVHVLLMVCTAETCLYRIRIWNTCHFRVCVLVMLCRCWILYCVVLCY